MSEGFAPSEIPVALKLRKANLVFIRLGLSLSISLFSIYLSAACIFKHHQLEKWSTMRMLFPRWLGINTTAVLIHGINSWVTPAHGSCESGSIPKKQSKKILLNPAKTNAAAPKDKNSSHAYSPPACCSRETPGRFRQALQCSSLSEINSDTFINMNKQQHWWKGISTCCITGSRAVATLK